MMNLSSDDIHLNEEGGFVFVKDPYKQFLLSPTFHPLDYYYGSTVNIPEEEDLLPAVVSKEEFKEMEKRSILNEANELMNNTD